MVGVWEMVVGDSYKRTMLTLARWMKTQVKCLFWYDLLFLYALKVARIKKKIIECYRIKDHYISKRRVLILCVSSILAPHNSRIFGIFATVRLYCNYLYLILDGMLRIQLICSAEHELAESSWFKTWNSKLHHTWNNYDRRDKDTPLTPRQPFSFPIPSQKLNTLQAFQFKESYGKLHLKTQGICHWKKLLSCFNWGLFVCLFGFFFCCTIKLWQTPGKILIANRQSHKI